MPASKYDLFIEQGVDYTLKFRWKTGEPASVVDVQAFTAAMQARLTYDDTVKLFDLALGTGITIDVDNYFVCSLTDTQTSALAYAEGKKVVFTDEDGIARDWYRVGVWDFEATSAGGITTRLLYGYLYVSPQVTR
jgi:hypothetical protein